MATAFDDWWSHAAKQLLDVAGAGSLVGMRGDLLDGFASTLEPIGMLDRHELRGLAARWWDDVSFDLETLATRGADGVVDGWLTTAGVAQEDGASLMDQPIVSALVPELLSDREDLAAEVAAIDAAIKVAEASSEDDEGASGDVDNTVPTPAELKALKAQRTTAKKALKALDAKLLEAATVARGQVDCEGLTCSLLRARLFEGLSRRVAVHRHALVNRYESWHSKYAVTLRDLEGERDAAARRLNDFIAELGYG